VEGTSREGGSQGVSPVRVGGRRQDPSPTALTSELDSVPH